MSLSQFERNKVRHKIRRVIWKSEDAIARLEEEIERFRRDLVTYEKDPHAPQSALDQLRAGIAGMESNLAELRARHNKFVAENRKASPAFPRGISA